MYSIKKITSSPVVDFAAEELKKYLRMMMPECGEIEIKYDPEAKEGFRLGVMADFGLDTSEAPDNKLDDIVHIDTDAQGGIISGNNARSVLLAVYRFLTLNGCRWLFPGVDGEIIPIKEVEGVKYHKMADNRYRGWCNEGAEYQTNMLEAIDFAPKLGMNIFMLEFFAPGYYNFYYEHRLNTENREPEPVTKEMLVQWKKQCEVEISKRGLQFHDIGHGWTTKGLGIDPETRFTEEEWEKRPEYIAAKEYIALFDGKRGIYCGDPWLTNFCMSNPEARRLVTKAVVDYAEISTNVDFLHVWLSDMVNNHCECEECVKKTATDWYMILLNEIDDELIRRGLDTHIVMICYYDTLFAPEVERLNNPDRFTILLAPITRTYTESVAQRPVSTENLPKYVRNKVDLPTASDTGIAFAKSWQETCNVDILVYEYHFWYNMAYEFSTTRFAQIINEDIKGYKYHKFGGTIEDGSQRGFFPNGFPFYTYGQTLFDTELDFEALKEDYFSHIYGEDWKKVVEFLEKLGELIDHKYMAGENSANKDIGDYYNPAMVEKLRQVRPLVEEFAPFVEEHKNSNVRTQTVSYRILRRYLEYVCGIADVMILKAVGAGKEAKDLYNKFLADFGKYEFELERYFDIFTLGNAMIKRILRKDGEKIDYGVDK